VDEFNTMMESLEPFWGIPPLDVESRTESALASSPDDLSWFGIKDHSILWGNGARASWFGDEVSSWFTPELLAILPDVRFAVNVLDEPRVLVAYDTLEAALRAAGGSSTSHISYRLNGSAGPEKVPVDFHEEGKQRAWGDLVLSCPIDSACRAESNPKTTANKGPHLGFVRSPAQSKDVCSHPSLQEQHGFFSTASTLHLTRTLVPIFSQGKPSSFQDLLYPSPWYPAKYKQGEYVEANDVDWTLKGNKLY
jgi:hypothetical protein